MKQLQLSQSPLVAVVNYAEVANVAAVAVTCISLLIIVNDAAVADVAAVAFISHVTLVNDATYALAMLLQLKLSTLLQLKFSTYLLLQLQ